MKIRTDTFDTFDTFLQKVKNTCDFYLLPDILIL